MPKEKNEKNLISQKYAIESFGNFISFNVPAEEIIQVCVEFLEKELPLKMITACDERADSGFFKIFYIFGNPSEHVFLAPFILTKKEFPSLTSVLHQASIFERKLTTFFGLIPVGHPNIRSLILHENWPSSVFPLRKDFIWNTRPDEAKEIFTFNEVRGEGVYEIPVGPVHAGIIEPGHFRFSVAGEEILHLEPRLGYSHKGSEKLFELLPLTEKIKLSERISGDSSYSHSLAFCQVVETLGGIEISERVTVLRVIYSELERLANHLGDIGAIMIDTGFNFGGAHGARLREIVMRYIDDLCGSRFLRGVNEVGGMSKDIENVRAEEMIQALHALEKDFSEVMHIAENNSSLIDRLKGTGVLDVKIAKDHGIVGVAGKAVGFDYDARKDFSYAAYDRYPVDVATEKSGDVYARFMVRIKEVYSSLSILYKAFHDIQFISMHDGQKKKINLKKNAYAVSIVEGWRGDIVYFVAIDSKGVITRVDVRDPSFLNWTVLGHAGRGNMVPDFPLINKSFNLSYSGNDL